MVNTRYYCKMSVLTHCYVTYIILKSSFFNDPLAPVSAPKKQQIVDNLFEEETHTPPSEDNQEIDAKEEEGEGEEQRREEREGKEMEIRGGEGIMIADEDEVNKKDTGRPLTKSWIIRFDPSGVMHTRIREAHFNQ